MRSLGVSFEACKLLHVHATKGSVVAQTKELPVIPRWKFLAAFLTRAEIGDIDCLTVIDR